jgi:hypothetical protein
MKKNLIILGLVIILCFSLASAASDAGSGEAEIHIPDTVNCDEEFDLVGVLTYNDDSVDWTVTEEWYGNKNMFLGNGSLGVIMVGERVYFFEVGEKITITFDENNNTAVSLVSSEINRAYRPLDDTSIRTFTTTMLIDCPQEDAPRVSSRLNRFFAPGEEATNYLWWILGIVALLIVIGFVIFYVRASSKAPAKKKVKKRTKKRK